MNHLQVYLKVMKKKVRLPQGEPGFFAFANAGLDTVTLKICSLSAHVFNVRPRFISTYRP